MNYGTMTYGDTENPFHEIDTWQRVETKPFTYPFAYTPDLRCQEAKEIVKKELEGRDELQEDIKNGKMFGVLICENTDGRQGFIASFSGTLGGRSHQKWFVPPMLDYEQKDGVFKTEEAAISELNRAISQREKDERYIELKKAVKEKEEESAQIKGDMKKQYAENKQVRKKLRTEHPEQKDELDRQSQFEKAEIKRTAARLDEELSVLRDAITQYEIETEALKTERKKRSNVLQRWLFSRMKAQCADGVLLSVWDIFQFAGKGVPPSGTGECAAPKLLNYAFAHKYKPISMAEFWMGASPKGEIRIEGQFYPACNQKCGPLLNRMMRGMDIDANPLEKSAEGRPLKILYEDEWLLIVDKPYGLMTVSEATTQETVMTQVCAIRNIEGPGYVHRLDMATSGIVVIAKDKATHQAMQHLFESREIKKRYVAIVEGSPKEQSGTIRLPLIPNIDDRPRQMVDFIRGKEAVTEYETIETNGATTRLRLYPLTGRTHQLRVHLASPLGLGCPIVGDNLYGHLGARLLLHSDAIWFTHPWTKKAVHISCTAEF